MARARKSAVGMVVPPAGEVFDLWAAVRMGAEDNALAPASVVKYRSIWASWLRFLVDRGCAWHRADGGLVRDFTAGLDARANGAHAPSYVSKRRYWRVLSYVYAFALQRRWVASNPAVEAAADVPRSETSAAVVLPPAYLEHLRAKLAGADVAPTWQALRDQALLAVLLDAALTTGEICALRVDQVLRYGQGGGIVLRVDGERPAQRRDLLLEPAATAVLRRWLTARHALYGDRADAPRALFTSQKAPGQLTPKSVFLLLQRLISGLEEEQGSHIAHRGANVIRSSVIAEWLHRGIAVSDVLARAGLDTERGLARLAHAR